MPPKKNERKLKDLKPKRPVEVSQEDEQYKRDLKQLKRLQQENHRLEICQAILLNSIGFKQYIAREHHLQGICCTGYRGILIVHQVASEMAERSITSRRPSRNYQTFLQHYRRIISQNPLLMSEASKEFNRLQNEEMFDMYQNRNYELYHLNQHNRFVESGQQFHIEVGQKFCDVTLLSREQVERRKKAAETELNRTNQKSSTTQMKASQIDENTKEQENLDINNIIDQLQEKKIKEKPKVQAKPKNKKSNSTKYEEENKLAEDTDEEKKQVFRPNTNNNLQQKRVYNTRNQTKKRQQ